MHLELVGMNHKTASVAIREKVALTEEELTRALSTLASHPPVAECVILSTCNRTEIYGVFREGFLEPEVLARFVSEYNQLNLDEVNPYLYRFSNEEVVTHLFYVISGLDSMVLGENQIAAQVKEAYNAATVARTTGLTLNHLFHTAFSVGKKIRFQTEIGAGSLSVSQVACDLAEKIFNPLTQCKALLIGAGQTGELTAEQLHRRGVKHLTLTNRTRARSEELAQKIPARVINFEDLKQALSEADIVISAVSVESVLLTQETVAAALEKRKLPLFLIDLGVPRNIDPAVDQLAEVFLYDMDTLQKIVESNRQFRSAEVHKAKRLIENEVKRFVEWHNSRKAQPVILEIQNKFEEVRKGELDKIRDQLSPEVQKLVEEVTRSMMNKILHHPIVSLREAAKNGAGQEGIETIRKILGLRDC